MTHKLIYILTVLLTITVYSGRTQTIPKNFSFVDSYGDSLTITNADKLPPPLDTTFFKTNLTSSYFDTALIQKTSRYDYILSDIKRTKKKNEFEFVLRVVPHSKNIEEILNFLGGFSHYRMTLKKVNSRLLIDSIEFLYGEI